MTRSNITAVFLVIISFMFCVFLLWMSYNFQKETNITPVATIIPTIEPTPLRVTIEPTPLRVTIEPTPLRITDEAPVEITINVSPIKGITTPKYEILIYLIQVSNKSKYQLSLLEAIIDQESEWDVYCVTGDEYGNSSSYGLCQINECNFKMIAKELDYTFDVYNFKCNIDGMIIVLNEGSRDFFEVKNRPPNIRELLTIYNAGINYTLKHGTTKYADRVLSKMEKYDILNERMNVK